MANIHGNKNTTKLINQLKQARTQYPCLTKKQEDELIEKYKDNREELNRLLFMHNVKIVFSMASKYVSKFRDLDTVVQDGFMGLGEAVKRFDLSKKIKFNTYATQWVRKYMSGYYWTSQFIKVDSVSTSMNAPSALAEDKQNPGQETTFENYIQDYIDPVYNDQNKPIESELSSIEQSEICDMLYSKLDKDTSLSATDKAVFKEIFVEHEKTRDIADKYNIGQDDISEIKRKILGKFKDILKTEYRINSFADLG